jgi:2,3-bisphosphoglycerate-independent phosphoglycerate mutase
MARILFLFLDGVGLGSDNRDSNPFVAANMPTIKTLLGGQRLLASAAPYEGNIATLLAVDARLGIDGKPQSATGQATLLTGCNVPKLIGSHYGPKPNPPIAEILKENNLFIEVKKRGGTAALLNAFPPGYFETIRSGRRLYSSITLAVKTAGLDLMTAEDLQSHRALSADFTGAGWVAQPDFPPAPVYTPLEAGALLADLSLDYHLAWFDFWPTDYAGHRGTRSQAAAMLESFDAVLDGLVENWESREDLIVITSDHGNLENLDQRGHTLNPVPALLIGPKKLRRDFAGGLKDLTDFAPAVLHTIFGPHEF